MKHLTQIAKIASEINAFMDNGDFVTSALSKKASDLTNLYPHDPTVTGMARTLAGMQSRQELISKNEFVKLYNRFYTPNNQFVSSFKKELGIKDASDLAAEAAKKIEKEKQSIKENAAAPSRQKADTLLASALEKILEGGKKEFEGYTKKQEANAVDCVSQCLSDMIPEMKCKLSVDAGNRKVVVVRGDFNTPKGRSSIYIPVEILDNDECICLGVFVGTDGVDDLSKRALISSIKKSVGKPARYTGRLILSAIMSKSGEQSKKVSNLELFFIEKKYAAASPNFYSTDTFLDTERKFFDGKPFFQEETFLPRPKFAGEEKFSEKLGSRSVQAEMKFGKEKILEAQKEIYSQLTRMNQRPYSIKVQSHNPSSVSFTIALASNAAIEMIAEIKDNKVQVAPYFTHDEVKYAFTADSFAKVAASEMAPASRAVHSPLYAQRAEEVLQIIAKSAQEGDMKTAEDGLNVIAQKHPKFQSVAYETFRNALLPNVAPKCAKMVSRASSIYPICAHTGLPVKDTFVDADGLCRPLYRRTQGQ